MARDYSKKEVLDIIEREAQQQGIPKDDFLRFAYIETGGKFDETAENSRTHAKGLFQFLHSSAGDYGLVGKEFDPVANTHAAAQMYQHNLTELTARHGRTGYPYLSGDAKPSGVDLYLAHQQGAAGYGSVQTAIATGTFGVVRDGRGNEIDMRSRVLGQIGGDASKLVGVSSQQMAAMSDRELASTFARYYDRKFDAISIPEKGIAPLTSGTQRSTAPAAHAAPQVRETVPPSKPSDRQEGVIALSAAHDMGVQYDSIRYGINRPSSDFYRGKGVDGKDLKDGYIDCSGWVSILENRTMDEINRKAGREVFSSRDHFVPVNDSAAAIIARSAKASGVHFTGDQVNVTNLKQGMAIGVDTGPKGIDHIVMVVKDPATGQLLASESTAHKNGPLHQDGVNVQPLGDYLKYAHAAGFKLSATDPLYKGRDLLQDKQVDRQQTADRSASADGKLALGEQGRDVKGLQQNLIRLGVKDDAGKLLTGTGYYGEHTRQAVANFQKANGLQVSGIADKATLDAIGKTLPDGKTTVDKPAVIGIAPKEQLGKSPPSITDATHPNHALYAAIGKQLPVGTKPEAIANVTMQSMENGMTTPTLIKGVVVNGQDAFVMGTTPGYHVSVDLQAPTASMSAMSEHMFRQTQQEQQHATQQTQQQPGPVQR